MRITMKNKLFRNVVIGLAIFSLYLYIVLAPKANIPIPIIFDTDIGNDSEDVIALSVLHALVSRGECELLAVTVSKDHPEAAAFVDAINTFYNRPDIPIGVVKNGKTKQRGSYLGLTKLSDGRHSRYPHDLLSGNEAHPAVRLLRSILATASDNSVVVIQVGFSTNLAHLMKSTPDSISPLSGIDLIRKKVRKLEVMAGAFSEKLNDEHFIEYNILKDVSSAKMVLQFWPTPVLLSGWEVGAKMPFPAESILNDFRFVNAHPVLDAYQLYKPTPHERPTWDSATVLHAVRPNADYFGLSPKGNLRVHEDGSTEFLIDKNGTRQYLTITNEQAARTLKTIVNLSSQKPK